MTDIPARHTETLTDGIQLIDRLRAKTMLPVQAARLYIRHLYRQCENSLRTRPAQASLFAEHYTHCTIISLQERQFCGLPRSKVNDNYRKRMQQRCQWPDHAPALIISPHQSANFEQSAIQHAGNHAK